MRKSTQLLDPELGPSDVFGPCRNVLLFDLGLGTFMAFAALSLAFSPDESARLFGPLMCGLIALFYLGSGLQTRKMRLIVGRDGFRYVGPSGTTQIHWRDVAEIDFERPGRYTERLSITVPHLYGVGPGVQITTNQVIGLSAPLSYIAQLMVQRRDACPDWRARQRSG